MSYQPFALKYRPQNFEEIVGQDHVSQTLRHAVAQGRVHHAYLFAGPRGTGKTSTARVLAKALNCVNGPTDQPCGECPACRAIQAGSYLDVIEIDAASHRGIDDIRELREKVKYGPAQGRCKVYILDEAHQLTTEASNALLKTLEEPPAHSYFILATTEAHKFLPTIMSRCQRFDFRAIPAAQIVAALGEIARREGVVIDEGGLWLIAEAAAGAMRDAESIFDQVVAYAEGAIDREVVAAVLGFTQQELLERTVALIAEGDLGALFALVDELIREGRDLPQYLKDLTAFSAELLRVHLGAEPSGWSRGAAERAQALRDLAGKLGRARLMGLITSLAAAQERLREGAQETLTVELVLAEVASRETETETAVASRESRVASPEKAGAETAQSTPPPAPSPNLGEGVPETAPAPTGEAPAPPAAPRTPRPVAQVATGGPITLERVLELWKRVLPEQLKRMKHQPVWAMLQEGTPVEVRGNTIRLAFPHEFHHNKVKTTYKGIIEEALQLLLGEKVEIEPYLGEPEVVARPETAQSTPPPAPCGADSAASPKLGEGGSETAQTPAEGARTPQAAVEAAVGETLELFEGSREVPEK